MPCASSFTSCALKICTPCKIEYIDELIVPPILSLESFFPDKSLINLFLERPINIGKPKL